MLSMLTAASRHSLNRLSHHTCEREPFHRFHTQHGLIHKGLKSKLGQTMGRPMLIYRGLCSGSDALHFGADR